jgi:hypothetical protein
MDSLVVLSIILPSKTVDCALTVKRVKLKRVKNIFLILMIDKV